MDYPKEIKAFYMRMNDDQKTVAAMDLLVPKVGELIGLINDEVEVPVHTVPVGSMFQTPIYKVKHTRTHQDLYISSGDIKR